MPKYADLSLDVLEDMIFVEVPEIAMLQDRSPLRREYQDPFESWP